MQQMVNVITPTFFAMALGFLFGRFSRTSATALIDVAMYIAVPCLAFTSMFSTPIVIREAAELWAACLLIMAGTWMVARLVFSFDRKKHSGLYLSVAFGNFVNIPLPIIYLAFGSKGVAIAVLFFIPSVLLTYSLAVYVAAGQVGLKQGVKLMLRTPLLYAAVVGLALALARVTPPDVVMNSLGFVGQAGVPLLLVVMGMSIGRIRITSLPLTMAASVLRMGGGFAFGLLAVWLLSLTGLARDIVLFESAMPAAIFSAILCTKYNNEAELVSSVVLVTTLASVLVVPALLLYLT